MLFNELAELLPRNAFVVVNINLLEHLPDLIVGNVHFVAHEHGLELRERDGVVVVFVLVSEHALQRDLPVGLLQTQTA